ncbi:MAG: DUF3854 domain-containing protein [Oscillatoriales cyanobacterium]|nr:MAG: DUF3854 domain-containing protein [Oscillatoriales cyanobacterium]
MQSGVDAELVRLNVVALDGTEAYDYLCYSDKLSRRNDGRLSGGMLKRYAHVEAGGWWCSGTNVLTGTDDLWGCFKPEQPRIAPDRDKPIKYEHPPKVETGVFALRVPVTLWRQIAERSGLTFDEQWIDTTRHDFGFWSWLVATPQVPICITEGAKKAGALLSAGYAAIGLPGINNGYRTPRDNRGHRIGKSRLIPPIEALMHADRPVYVAFDRDTKPKTIKAVNAAIRRLGYLISQTGAQVQVVTWSPELGKGVDDLIAHQGREAFDRAVEDALSLDTWKARLMAQLTYPIAINLHSRFLPSDLAIPAEARLVALRSPKGTGKTEVIRQWVQQAIAQGRRVLVIGHRVQLVTALCQRFGLPYVTQVDDLRQVGSGYGLCVDSLHSASQAKFRVADWQNAIVIFDEVEQVLWHALNSDTCRNQRVDVLGTLTRLMQATLGDRGCVYAADADLSDTSLDYLLALAGVPPTPATLHVIRNEWRPDADRAWQVSHYTESTPKRLLRELEAHIAEGGRPLVCLSAQKLKSKWSTTAIAAYFEAKFPDCKILRIDSETVTDASHPAYHCMADLDQHLTAYDIVLVSPSLETGISLDLRGHFTSVWAIAQGIQSENSVRQSLSRLREPVPRHLWAAPYGFNKIGNGSTSIPVLMGSTQGLTQVNIRLLQQSDFSGFDDFDAGFQAESLQCWAKFAVRVNAAMSCYREAIVTALAAEGHTITTVARASTRKSTASSPKQPTLPEFVATIASVREQNYLEECQAIARARDLNHRQYRALRQTLVKSKADRLRLRKYELKRRYGVPVTINLVRKDDDNWYEKLRLHYFLTEGRDYLTDRDQRVARQILNQGGGQVFTPDFNRSQLGATIGILELLGLPVLLAQTDRELRNSDADLQQMAATALGSRSQIKAAIRIGLAKNSTPIMVLRRLLDQVGFGLVCLRNETVKRKRVRVYGIETPTDDRASVFKHWLATDQRFPGWSEQAVDFWDQATLPIVAASIERNFEQLSLKGFGDDPAIG